MRRQFAATMLRLMATDASIIVLLGDIGIHAFKPHAERWPDRVINCGVCEQGMVGMAAGLSKAGFYPVVHTIASFMARRAYEQIYVDFGLNKLPGLLVSVGAGREYEALGETHCCEEDTVLMSLIPGMGIFTEMGAGTVDAAIERFVTRRELAYIRLVKEPAHA